MATLDNVILVLQSRIDEQFRITERLDSKGRQGFAITAAFFGGGQAVAFSSFAADDVTSGEKLVVLIAAAFALLGLLVVGRRVTRLLHNREETEFDPDDVARWWKEGGES